MMKTHTKYLTFNTRQRRELLHITPQVAEAVRESGIQEGFVLVSAMHITAGIFVNDNEPGLHHDIMEWLEQLAPAKPDYQHHHTGEDNADAHLKSLLVHHEVIVPITAGKLDLGTWQASSTPNLTASGPSASSSRRWANSKPGATAGQADTPSRFIFFGVWLALMG